MTFKGRGGILRSSVDVQTIKRTASTALMKSRSIFVYYVRIDRNQVYRDHFELISKKQNRTANANITLQKRTLDELDNNFLEVFYSGSALQQGANAIEVDLSVSADGQVFLWHDPSPLSMHAIARRLVISFS